MDGPGHDQGPPRRTSLKRTFDQISRSPPPQSASSAQPAWATRFHQAVRDSSSSNADTTTASPSRPENPAERHRFAGDGLDFRRPIMSQSFDQSTGRARSRTHETGPQVIDLTGDSPETVRINLPRRRSHSPRGSRPTVSAPDVIDLDTVDEGSDGIFDQPMFRPPERQDRRADTPAVDLTGPTPEDLEDDDNEVQFIRANPIQPRRQPSMRDYLRSLARPDVTHPHYPRFALGPYANPTNTGRQRSPWPGAAYARLDHRMARLDQSLRQNEQAANQATLGTHIPTGFQPRRPFGTRFSSMFTGFLGPGPPLPDLPSMPDTLNFSETAFNYRTGQPTRPTYEAPPPVGEGLTRSPQEGDILVCPNCDHELGTGEEAEKQIWAIRECGHVYCGACATTRKIGNRKAANVPSLDERPRKQATLETCAIEACPSKTAGKSKMFQVYF